MPCRGRHWARRRDVSPPPLCSVSLVFLRRGVLEKPEAMASKGDFEIRQHCRICETLHLVTYRQVRAPRRGTRGDGTAGFAPMEPVDGHARMRRSTLPIARRGLNFDAGLRDRLRNGFSRSECAAVMFDPLRPDERWPVYATIYLAGDSGRRTLRTACRGLRSDPSTARRPWRRAAASGRPTETRTVEEMPVHPRVVRGVVCMARRGLACAVRPQG